MNQLNQPDLEIKAANSSQSNLQENARWLSQLLENPAASSASKHANLLFELVSAACNHEEVKATGWKVSAADEAGKGWIRVTHPQTRPPSQGWKLHISATVAAAPQVLQQALPVLLAEDASFKVAGSLEKLVLLNQGRGMLSQIGKFITVYPNNDEQAVRLAVALDRATAGLSGPAIPSDKPLTPGSLVHYRYGGFEERIIQTPHGEVVAAIADPQGELVPDRRLSSYYAPEWVTDPFLAAGVTTERPAINPRISHRFLLMKRLHQSPRGTVHLAVDLQEARACVIKQAYRAATAGPDGRDAQDRLRHEAEVLRRLAPDPRFPMVYELIEQGDDYLALAMEDVEGLTLESAVNLQLMEQDLPTGEQVVAWGRALAKALGTIHAHGMVYRDLKSSNVIVAPDGYLRLIDFELVHELNSPERPFGLGTRGYMSPQQARGERPAITDDIYSLGALLYFTATAAEPSAAPNQFGLMERPVSLLNPAISPDLEAIIARCLEADPARRFPTMEALEAALAQLEQASVPAPAFGAEQTAEPEEKTRQHYRELARRLGDSLVKTAEPVPGGKGLAWLSAYPGAMGLANRDINSGSAGTVLALAELVARLDIPEHRATLAEAVRWLQVAPRPGGDPLPGLYVGEGGIAVALLRAGQVLGNEQLIAAANERANWIATLPQSSPDLFNGSAGRIRMHLLLWDETGDPAHLHAARTAGESLLATAHEAGEGELRWTIPAGYSAMSNQNYLGYAHGAAGIGDCLLDLYEATQEERFKEAAAGAARWLKRQAIPVLSDRSGLDWPSVEGVKGRGAGMWCHGATGVGRFMLRAMQMDLIPEAAELAERAARMVARGTRWSGPVHCHGLSGSIEFLLDMYQATHDRAYLAEAYSLGRLLQAFLVERDGLLVCSSESPTIFSQDYMIGYAGVAVCLLRLSEPEETPYQLSRRGFRTTGVRV